MGYLLRTGGARRSEQFSIARFFVVPECHYVDGIFGRLITVQSYLSPIAKADDQLAQLGHTIERAIWGTVSNRASRCLIAAPARLAASMFMPARKGRHRSRPRWAPTVTISRGGPAVRLGFRHPSHAANGGLHRRSDAVRLSDIRPKMPELPARNSRVLPHARHIAG
jgi:hypothetical protein